MKLGLRERKAPEDTAVLNLETHEILKERERQREEKK